MLCSVPLFDVKAKYPRWRFNISLLSSQTFIISLKEYIKEFLKINMPSNVDPQIMWETTKCAVQGFCISFSSTLAKTKTHQYTQLENKIKTLQNLQKQSFKSNQIKSLLSHHHSTSALVSEILMSVLQTAQKNNNNNLHMDRQCKKTNKQFTYGQTVQKNCTGAYTVLKTVQKTTTTIYIWTVHIYRLYRRQCAKYTYIYSVHIVYYKDTLNYQRHIIHCMGTSTLCTVSIHNVVYT